MHSSCREDHYQSLPGSGCPTQVNVQQNVYVDNSVSEQNIQANVTNAQQEVIHVAEERHVAVLTTVQQQATAEHQHVVALMLAEREAMVRELQNAAGVREAALERKLQAVTSEYRLRLSQTGANARRNEDEAFRRGMVISSHKGSTTASNAGSSGTKDKEKYSHLDTPTGTPRSLKPEKFNIDGQSPTRNPYDGVFGKMSWDLGAGASREVLAPQEPIVVNSPTFTQMDPVRTVTQSAQPIHLNLRSQEAVQSSSSSSGNQPQVSMNQQPMGQNHGPIGYPPPLPFGQMGLFPSGQSGGGAGGGGAGPPGGGGPPDFPGQGGQGGQNDSRQPAPNPPDGDPDPDGDGSDESDVGSASGADSDRSRKPKWKELDEFKVPGFPNAQQFKSWNTSFLQAIATTSGRPDDKALNWARKASNLSLPDAKYDKVPGKFRGLSRKISLSLQR